MPSAKGGVDLLETRFIAPFGAASELLFFHAYRQAGLATNSFMKIKPKIKKKKPARSCDMAGSS
jgi:hypothetical protein